MLVAVEKCIGDAILYSLSLSSRHRARSRLNNLCVPMLTFPILCIAHTLFVWGTRNWRTYDF